MTKCGGVSPALLLWLLHTKAKAKNQMPEVSTSTCEVLPGAKVSLETLRRDGGFL